MMNVCEHWNEGKIVISRDECPEFDRMLSQAADTGRITDVNGVTRKVIGAVIYCKEEVIED